MKDSKEKLRDSTLHFELHRHVLRCGARGWSLLLQFLLLLPVILPATAMHWPRHQFSPGIIFHSLKRKKVSQSFSVILNCMPRLSKLVFFFPSKLPWLAQITRGGIKRSCLKCLKQIRLQSNPAMTF